MDSTPIFVVLSAILLTSFVNAHFMYQIERKSLKLHKMKLRNVFHFYLKGMLGWPVCLLVMFYELSEHHSFALAGIMAWFISAVGLAVFFYLRADTNFWISIIVNGIVTLLWLVATIGVMILFNKRGRK